MHDRTPKFWVGPDRPEGTVYVSGLPHERNKGIHPGKVWEELGLDKDKKILWNTLVTEDFAGSMLFNWTWSNNYHVADQNRNTIVLKRNDPERVCQWLIWRRKSYIPFDRNTDQV